MNTYDQQFKLAEITAKRKAEFAALAAPVEKLQLPTPGGFTFVKTVDAKRPFKALLTAHNYRKTVRSLIPVFKPAMTYKVEPKVGFSAPVLGIPATIEPRQARPDYSTLPTCDNVLFDARLPYGQRHQVTFTAGAKYGVVIQLPIADLNVGLAENAFEVAERLRNLYRKAQVERPLAVDGYYTEEGHWKESTTDTCREELVENWPLTSRMLAKVGHLSDLYGKVTMHVWDGMADEVAAVIEKAALNWHLYQEPVKSVSGSTRSQMFTASVKDPQLQAVAVTKRTIDPDSGELKTSRDVGVWDAHTEMIYFEGYLDNAQKSFDYKNQVIESYTFLDDSKRLSDMRIHCNGSVSYQRTNTHCIPITNHHGHHAPLNLDGRSLETAAEMIRLRRLDNTQWAADDEAEQWEDFCKVINAVRTTHRDAMREREQYDASPSKRQETNERSTHKSVRQHMIKAKTVYLQYGPLEDRGVHGRLAPGERIVDHKRQPVVMRDRGTIAAPKLDEIAFAEIKASWDDAFNFDRTAEIVNWDRADNMAFDVPAPTQTRFYGDGTLIDEGEKITARGMVAEKLEPGHPNRLGLNFNANRPLQPQNPYKDKPAHRIIIGEGFAPMYTLTMNKQAWYTANAEAWTIYRESAKKATTPRKLALGTYPDVVIVTNYHKLAHDGSHEVIYCGRGSKRQDGSVLANGDIKSPAKYKRWLWEAMQKPGSPVQQELVRISNLIRAKKPIALTAWPDVDPKMCKAGKKTPPKYLHIICAAALYYSK